MITCQWDHLQVCSEDPEATAAWFARCLNAEIVRRPGRVDFRLGDIQVFITGVAPAPRRAPAASAMSASSATGTPPGGAARVPGIDHFGVTVADLDAAFAHFISCEAEIVEPIKPVRAGVRACFVRAPGDILVEVLERRPSEMTFG